MGGKRAEPPPAESAAAGERSTAEQARQGEQVGPLAIERLRKDDGRALIVYSLAQGQT